MGEKLLSLVATVYWLSLSPNQNPAATFTRKARLEEQHDMTESTATVD